MDKQITVQAVAGAIRSTKGVLVSRKYAPNKYSIGGSSVRSAGIYTEKCYGTIIVGFWNSSSYPNKSEENLTAVIATLRAKGMNVIERTQGYSTFLEVIGA